MRVACIREAGPVFEVQPCFERLLKWAALIEVPTGRMLTLSFQRPGKLPRRWYHSTWQAKVHRNTCARTRSAL